MTELHKSILQCYARNNMQLQPTARELRYHRNSVLYHLRKIKAETGLNPHEFFDLCVLLFSHVGGVMKLPEPPKED